MDEKNRHSQDIEQRIVALRPLLMEAARRISGDEAAAEDTVQEVMLKLWDRRERLDGHPNIQALALTMIHHLTVDDWRHRQLEHGKQAAEPFADDSGRSIERRDELRLIGEIISRLPPLQARILRMKDIEGYETDEIAAVTGATTENIRQCLSRARKTIRQEYIKLTTTRLWT